MSRARETLDRAYRNARYRVDDGGAVFDMRVGRPCEPLRALMTRRGVREAAFLTACNPGSAPRSDADNRAAQVRLRAALDPEGIWPPEPSLLVLGIERERAAALARRFRQNAFVWLPADAVPVLVWTGEPEDVRRHR